ncbi:MAG: glutamate 5-kinase [Cyanobacteria bacterium P01_H01_bin.121]
MLPTLVIKIGTSSLTKAQTGHMALATIASLVEILCELRQTGYPVILVSSGAVGVGCRRLGISERPKSIARKQAVAAVGQGRLMRIYDDLFTSLGQPIAQVLLTRSDLVQRSRYVNADRTFRELLQLGVIPIVNENDTVAIEELKFGDNDTLSAQVASLVGASWLFLLTDVDRLYSADPRFHPDAHPIELVEDLEQLEQLHVDVGQPGSQWGTGGMITKISAAKIATTAGVRTVITDGQQPHNILKILAGESIGTQFEPQQRPVNARKRWIAHGSIVAGTLYLDEGAVEAVVTSGKSILAVGITECDGEFQHHDAVAICDRQGQELGRGIINYDSQTLQRILGQKTAAIAQLLNLPNSESVPEVIHRDNLVLTTPSTTPSKSQIATH